MSCWTAYLVREADGSAWIVGDSGRGHAITDVADRDDTLARIRRHGHPRELAQTSDGYVGGAFCFGALIDFVARRYRHYPCYGERAPLDQVDQEIKASPAWEGWDAGIAMGGREELGELLPEAARIIQPFDVLDDAHQPMTLYPRDDWFVAWDPIRFALEVRHSAYWVSPFSSIDVVTTIGTDGTTRDFRVVGRDTTPLHPILVGLRSGPDALDALCSAAPHPAPTEDETVAHTVVIDHPRSIIHHSPTAFAPARLLDAVRSAWPGWQLRILPTNQPVTGMPDGTPIRRAHLDMMPLEEATP